MFFSLSVVALRDGAFIGNLAHGPTAVKPAPARHRPALF
jgi:hypothetical protein